MWPLAYCCRCATQLISFFWKRAVLRCRNAGYCNLILVLVLFSLFFCANGKLWICRVGSSCVRITFAQMPMIRERERECAQLYVCGSMYIRCCATSSLWWGWPCPKHCVQYLSLNSRDTKSSNNAMESRISFHRMAKSNFAITSRIHPPRWGLSLSVHSPQSLLRDGWQ